MAKTYATWNPSDKHANVALSNGDLTATDTTGTVDAAVRSTQFKTTGKWYWEITLTDASVTASGINVATGDLGQVVGNPSSDGAGRNNGGHNYADSPFTRVLTEYVTLSNGNVVNIAVDIDAGKLWYGKNGTWSYLGDPATGANPAVTFAGGLSITPAVSVKVAEVVANFGASAFSGSVPAGFNEGWYYEPNLYERDIDEALAFAEILAEKYEKDVTTTLILAELLAERYPFINEETISLVDLSSGGFNYEKIVESILNSTDLTLMQFVMTALDTIGLADNNNCGIFEDIVESLILSEVVRALDFALISEMCFLYDLAQPNWDKTVPESLTLTDSISKILTLMISEWLTLIDTQTNMWHGVEEVPEVLSLYDLAKDIQQFSKTIDESLVTTDTAVYQLCLTVLEYLGFTELAAGLRKYVDSISESVTLTDDATKGFDAVIVEALTAVDVVSVVTTFMNSIAESLVTTDAATLIAKLGVSVTSPLVYTETLLNQGHFHSAAYDTLRMSVIVELDGETWECYVLNTPKFMPSMYSGFDFNSYCVFENRAFGANDTGIYELAGTTDAGAEIHTGAVFSETDFGVPNQKRFRRGYIGITGSSPVMVFETEDGKREVYTIDTQGKVVASSELKAKKWKLSIADYNKLSTIKLLPVILTK